MKLVYAPRKELNVVLEKRLSFSRIDEDGVALAVDPPDTLDARFEPEAQDLLRLLDVRVPAAPAAKIVSEQPGDILQCVVFPRLLGSSG